MINTIDFHCTERDSCGIRRGTPLLHRTPDRRTLRPHPPEHAPRIPSPPPNSGARNSPATAPAFPPPAASIPPSSSRSSPNSSAIPPTSRPSSPTAVSPKNSRSSRTPPGSPPPSPSARPPSAPAARTATPPPSCLEIRKNFLDRDVHAPRTTAAGPWTWSSTATPAATRCSCSRPTRPLMHNYSGMGLGGGTGSGIDPFITNKQIVFMGDSHVLPLRPDRHHQRHQGRPGHHLHHPGQPHDGHDRPPGPRRHWTRTCSATSPTTSQDIEEIVRGDAPAPARRPCVRSSDAREPQRDDYRRMLEEDDPGRRRQGHHRRQGMRHHLLTATQPRRASADQARQGLPAATRRT